MTAQPKEYKSRAPKVVAMQLPTYPTLRQLEEFANWFKKCDPNLNAHLIEELIWSREVGAWYCQDCGMHFFVPKDAEGVAYARDYGDRYVRPGQYAAYDPVSVSVEVMDPREFSNWYREV